MIVAVQTRCVTTAKRTWFMTDDYAHENNAVAAVLGRSPGHVLASVAFPDVAQFTRFMAIATQIGRVTPAAPRC